MLTFLYLNSDKMGDGNKDLGRKLLKSFLSKLADSATMIDLIGCVNSGVYLTTEGSEVIDILKKFEAKGVRIASCGTCLDHLDLTDKLLIGEIGNMESTVQIMTTADKIIQPN
jgi:selenium metabolism protein YedF